MPQKDKQWSTKSHTENIEQHELHKKTMVNAEAPEG